MTQPLPRAFYARPPVEVARDLLGKLLVRRFDQVTVTSRVVETEAYLGLGDAAAHGAIGKTKRTAILFGAPGHAYVYQLRAYYLLNVVTEEVGMPSCVLFRALEPLDGTEYLRHLAGLEETHATRLMNGPGKLCRALQINLAHYGTDLTSKDSPLYITDTDNAPFEIATSTRIGITKAADLPYRFTIKGNPFTSR